MAEGLAKVVLGPKFEIESAGSTPTKINSFAIKVLHDIGIDISNNKSKSFEDLLQVFTSNLDLLITLCNEEVCPNILLNCEKIHWPVPDPASFIGSYQEKQKKFTEARDLIQFKLEKLKQDLTRPINL